MAKVTRATHKLFGLSGSSDNFARFGSKVAGTPIKTKDIDSIQSLPAWDEGLQESVYGANKAIFLEDLNSVIYEHSYQIASLLQDGISSWDDDTTYFEGSIVRRDGTFELYGSIIDNNLGNILPAQTNDANWEYLNPAPIPVGTSLDFMGRIIPIGFLGEDGGQYSRVTYANLLAAISVTMGGNLTNGLATVTGIPSTTNIKAGDFMSGAGIATGARVLTVDSGTQVTMTLNATSTQTPSTILFAPWGVGDGTTTFNTPDTRRKVSVGVGGAATATLGNQVGANGGGESHVLTIAEMPSHKHAAVNFANQGAAGISNFLTSGADTGLTGGDGAHNNMQPSYVVTKIIKY